MRFNYDLPESIAVEEEREHLVIEGQQFAKREFRCKGCASTHVTVDYVDQRRVQGVDAIAVGATCDQCGSTAMHVGY
ncbi:hypothetical protein [Halomarina oriensis]|uniref:Uncharacterized protein n=1 Tax=Halomarina oriensis TaxID=671145 RepID=A0A6B0GTC4_9EURY|nr:hypothetical protein [Halomarina oriensis]MWG36939.1 hypothetical protein [Halomarina oriensis]